jgi:hypothetical protein
MEMLKRLFDDYKAVLGSAIGVGAGIAGGIYVGEYLNNNVELLKQAPDITRYLVYAGTTIVSIGFWGGTGYAATSRVTSADNPI